MAKATVPDSEEVVTPDIGTPEPVPVQTTSFLQYLTVNGIEVDQYQKAYIERKVRGQLRTPNEWSELLTSNGVAH